MHRHNCARTNRQRSQQKPRIHCNSARTDRQGSQHKQRMHRHNCARRHTTITSATIVCAQAQNDHTTSSACITIIAHKHTAITPTRECIVTLFCTRTHTQRSHHKQRMHRHNCTRTKNDDTTSRKYIITIVRGHTTIKPQAENATSQLCVHGNTERIPQAENVTLQAREGI